MRMFTLKLNMPYIYIKPHQGVAQPCREFRVLKLVHPGKMPRRHMVSKWFLRALELVWHAP
jgi:hypothetical protein